MLNLYAPLDRLYALRGAPLPHIEAINSATMPQPYQSLLVHTNDMTPTLSAFYREEIGLRVLARQLEGEILLREVALLLPDEKTIVEYGAIAIHLEQFPPPAREAVLAGHLPLGTVLARYAVPHVSCPQAFVQVVTNTPLNVVFGLTDSTRLYGRRNILATPDGAEIANILEILPYAD